MMLGVRSSPSKSQPERNAEPVLDLSGIACYVKHREMTIENDCPLLPVCSMQGIKVTRTHTNVISG